MGSGGELADPVLEAAQVAGQVSGVSQRPESVVQRGDGVLDGGEGAGDGGIAGGVVAVAEVGDLGEESAVAQCDQDLYLVADLGALGVVAHHGEVLRAPTSGSKVVIACCAWSARGRRPGPDWMA